MIQNSVSVWCESFCRSKHFVILDVVVVVVDDAFVLFVPVVVAV